MIPSVIDDAKVPQSIARRVQHRNRRRIRAVKGKIWRVGLNGLLGQKPFVLLFLPRWKSACSIRASACQAVPASERRFGVTRNGDPLPLSAASQPLRCNLCHAERSIEDSRSVRKASQRKLLNKQSAKERA